MQMVWIAEPQLSLSAWRAACIVNDLAGHEIYETRQADNCMHWTTAAVLRAAVA